MTTPSNARDQMSSGIPGSLWLRARIGLFIPYSLVMAAWMVVRMPEVGVVGFGFAILTIGWDLVFVRWGHADSGLPLWGALPLSYPHSLLAPAGAGVFIALISVPIHWWLVGLWVLALLGAFVPSRLFRRRHPHL